MLRIIERIVSVDSNSPLLLTFTRLVETFLACIIPSAITIYVLSKKPVINLMYAMYFAGMVLCLCANGYFWYQFMKVLRSWKKYLRVNLGTYLVFAAAMIGGYYIADDPRVYTAFFGIYRALECFDLKTIVSLAAMNVLSLGVLFVAGAAGMNAKSHRRAKIAERTERFSRGHSHHHRSHHSHHEHGSHHGHGSHHSRHE